MSLRLQNNILQDNLNSTSKQSGVVLVIVLWMLSLLIVLATGYSHMVRTEIGLTANLVHYSQAKAIAEAGVWQTVIELLKPRVEQKWKTNGTMYSFVFKQGIVNLNIIDEAGKISLNTGSPELIHGLIDSIDLPEEDGQALLQSIMDWRDKDDLVRNYGAEDDDYLQNNYNYNAKDGPFNSLDELQLVMGMSIETYNKLKPALTVHSHQSGINLDSAPKEVLLAIPGISETEVEEFLLARADINNTQLPDTLIEIDSKYLSRSNERIFTIRSEGIIGKTHARLSVVVLMKKYLGKPYAILSWQESQDSNKLEYESEQDNS
jgi:general secretion pathway protein K